MMENQRYSPDGFLIDQTALADVPFGWRMSNQNGCGWIACYNLLHLLGDTRPATEVRTAIERLSPFGALIGANFFSLAAYLWMQGHPVSFTLCLPGDPLQLRHASDGILLYRHRKGAHFAAFHSDGEQLRFLNVRYGDVDDRRTLEDFFATQHAFPLALALTADSPHRQRRRRAKLARMREVLRSLF